MWRQIRSRWVGLVMSIAAISVLIVTCAAPSQTEVAVPLQSTRPTVETWSNAKFHAFFVWNAASEVLQAELVAPSTNPWPNLSTGQGTVWRSSETTNSAGHFLPPWTNVEVSVGGLNQAPQLGDPITILPLGVEIAPFDLTVIAAEGVGCGDAEQSWNLTLSSPTLPALYNAEAIGERRGDVPFGVVALYPAVANGRLLNGRSLTPAQLPPGILSNTVRAAIDLTANGNPDLVMTYHCCSMMTMSTDCEYHCGEEYRLGPEGWMLIEAWNPC